MSLVMFTDIDENAYDACVFCSVLKDDIFYIYARGPELFLHISIFPEEILHKG